MQPPIHTIRDRLLQGVDKDYNVVDMAIVVEVISQLEKYAITKEALEATRLGKHINELRRKASDKQLASRAKSLVKKWRELLMPTSGSGTATPVQQQNSSKDQVSAQVQQVAPPVQVVQPNNNMAAAMAQRLTNGHHNNHHRVGQASSQPSSRLTSPAVSSSSRLSPGLSTPTGLGGGPNNVPTARVMPISSSSMPSSASSSPGLSRPTTPNHHHNHQNHHSNHNSRPVSPAVPKTNAANKRLRKEMLETDGPDEDSIVNVTDLSTNTSSPAAKKAKTSSKQKTLSPPVAPINHLINGSSSSVNKPNCDTASNGHTAKLPILEDDKASERVRGMSNIEDQTTPKKAALQTPKVSRKKALEQEREHLLEQKVLSARRQASKVKTTQELVQELALRSSTPTGPVKTSSSSSHLVNETKTELMNRFFESQNGNGNNQHSDVLSPPLSDGPPSPNSNLTTAKSGQNLAKTNDSNNKVQSVEDILAQLPPIDTVAILAEINSEIMQNPDENSSNHDGENDNNSDVNNDNSDVDMATESDQEEIEGLIPIPVTKKLKKTRQSRAAKARENSNSKKKLSKGVEAALVDELHAGQHESVNGNFNHDGAFKEWHEVVTKETVNGDLLYILPYSVID